MITYMKANITLMVGKFFIVSKVLKGIDWFSDSSCQLLCATSEYETNDVDQFAITNVTLAVMGDVILQNNIMEEIDKLQNNIAEETG
jgi:hypothetical protein